MRENVFEFRKAIFHLQSTFNDFIDPFTLVYKLALFRYDWREDELLGERTSD